MAESTERSESKEPEECRSSGNLKKSTYEALLDRFMHGVYNPGDVLNERQLVGEMKISKSPIREALIELCQEGLLRCIPRYGYEVTFFSKYEIEEMLSYRAVLECGFLKLTFPRLNEKSLSSLEEECLLQNEDEPNEAFLHWNNNNEFHLKLMSYAKNEYALGELKALLKKMGIVYVRNYWEKHHSTSVVTTPAIHKEIVDALKGKDLGKATVLLRKDIFNFGFVVSPKEAKPVTL